jgi:hypothetical protein
MPPPSLYRHADGLRARFFVPGDSPKKLDKAMTSGADALIAISRIRFRQSVKYRHATPR